MTPLRDRPIRQKITFVILLISSAVLLLACTALFVFQAYTIRKNFIRELTAMGGMVASNVAVAAMFDDGERATQTLAGFQAIPQIVSAHLELNDGTRLAHFGPADDFQSSPKPAGTRVEGSRVLLAQPVMRDGQRHGTLYLHADFQKVYAGLLTLYGGIFAAVLAASLLLAFLLSSRLQHFITAPILRLAGTARTIAEDKDYAVRAEKAGGDEVGVLTDAFNQMLAQIQQADEALRLSQQKLLETSRLAGMAEVATGVLHNVGNVLNSVNVSASLVLQKLRRSKAPKLGKAAALLTARNGDIGDFLTRDPDGQRLPGYLAKLGEFLVAENGEILREVDQLGRNIEHIKEIVAMQQSYAKVSGVFETLPPERLVEDAIAMNTGAFERHGVVVERRFCAVPPVRVDRHKVLQILINLLGNAKYALDEVQRADKRIAVTIHATADGRCVRIEVADNGIGISPENLTRIFAHGFTTRATGHGFGLHSGALAAREIGGALTGASDGPGHGATFTLELPIAPATPPA